MAGVVGDGEPWAGCVGTWAAPLRQGGVCPVQKAGRYPVGVGGVRSGAPVCSGMAALRPLGSWRSGGI